MSTGEETPEEPKPTESKPPEPPVGVKVNKRKVMVEGQLVEMPEADQIRQA